jgi:hypothetical protein
VPVGVLVVTGEAVNGVLTKRAAATPV